MRDELITALLRALPKAIRRHVVPAADWAAKFSPSCPHGPERGAEREPFAARLGRTIRQLTFAPVDPSDFDVERVPPHLRVTFRAVDERGRTLGSSKDLGDLQARLADKAATAVASTFAAGRDAGRDQRMPRGESPSRPDPAPPTAPARPADPALAERTGITTWEWDELPAHLDTRQAGNVIRAYPALVEEGSSVALRLVATGEERDRASRRGIRRLLILATPSPVAYVQEHLSNDEKLQLAASNYSGTRALLDDCLAACVDAELRVRHPDGLLRTRAEFETVRDAVAAEIMDRMFETVSLVARIVKASRDADRAIAKASSMHLMAALGDARAQLEGLVSGRIRLGDGARTAAAPAALPRGHRACACASSSTTPVATGSPMNQLEGSIAAFEAAGGRDPDRRRRRPSG